MVNIKRSRSLLNEIELENKEHPEWAAINNAYAFEAPGMPVTLGYLLHAIRKAEIKGTHILELVLTSEKKWPLVEAMYEAYNDFLALDKRRT